jgi:hypothetical protein
MFVSPNFGTSTFLNKGKVVLLLWFCFVLQRAQIDQIVADASPSFVAWHRILSLFPPVLAFQAASF